MDYLLSLVGKDEETILDAMKEMVENVNKDFCWKTFPMYASGD